jgi:hypothetical protein
MNKNILNIKIESLDPTGIAFKSDSLKIELENIDSNKTDRLFLHVGEYLYRINNDGKIIETIVSHNNNK